MTNELLQDSKAIGTW